MQYDVTHYEQEENYLNLIDEELPLVKLQLSKEQLQIILNKMPEFLVQYEQKLQQNGSRFQSASSMNQRSREIKQRYATITRDWQSEALWNEDKASRLYDGVSAILEFIMKEIAYKDGFTFLEEVSKQMNKKKDIELFKKQLAGFFMLHFALSPTIQNGNLDVDLLGVNDTGTLYSFYIFAGYDVLYHFPKMFKTEDVPGFVLNLAYDLQQTQSLGQTKGKITSFALQRAKNGLALKQLENKLFSFQSKPLFKVALSAYSLPLIKGRSRYIVHMLENQDETPINGAFIAFKFDELTSDELDFDHIPMRAFIFQGEEELTEFVEEITENKNYYQVLLQRFLKEYKGGN